MGHLRDLPKSQFGVNVEDGFTPRYITIRGKGPLLKELKDAAKKADRIFLATDPDREGEAISWHLAEALGIDPEHTQRIEFHEITKDAVSHAIRHARPVNMPRVNAQQARRILDRVVGYQLSPLLWHKIRPGLSAGRVQSAALKLLVDREDAVLAFVPQQYFTIGLEAGTEAGGPLAASYAGPQGEKGRVSAEDVAGILGQVTVGTELLVNAVKTKERRRFPGAPFTTSTLQQEASKRLGFSVKRTMSLAQQLYEGLDVKGEGTVGLVTYIRTDSVRIAESAEDEVRHFIEHGYGSLYLKDVDPRRQDRNPVGSQGAHEAIRPTVVLRTPDKLKDSLNRDQLRLYRLIWQRFVASQMAAQVFDATTVELEAHGEKFRAHGSLIKFAGFAELYQDAREASESKIDSNEDDPSSKTLPVLVEGQRLPVLQISEQEHFTEPPARFTEGSLVRTLEELGIGRPSTYAPIIDTLLQRRYVERTQRRLFPTDLGRVVVELLSEYFPEIVNTTFTAEVESQLDRVEANEMAWQNVLTRFYGPFAEELARAEADVAKMELPEEPTDEVCDRCGKPMTVKYGRFGKFLACSGYPDCDFTKPFLEKTPALCPRCARPVVVRRTRKGRTFYGCSGYPECDFVTWNQPTDKLCPQCGSSMAVKRRGQRESVLCLKEGCGYESEQAQ